MKKFTCVQDIGNLKSAIEEAFEIKKDRFKYVELGKNKTLMMIFFNSSLRGTWCNYGRRQTGTFAGSDPCNGLLLRCDRSAFFCTLRRP